MYSPHVLDLLVIFCSVVQVAAFVPSFKQNLPPIHSKFAVTPENDGGASFSTESMPDIDPACPVDDEDCLVIESFSSAPRLSDADLLQSLKRRSRFLGREPVLKNWKSGICPTTKVSISSSDAVRRVCMDHYPIAACGSASGRIYLVDLEEQCVMSSVQAHLSMQNDVRGSSDVVKRQAMEKLYGKLDGGGVISIAMRDGVVASSGREGGVKLWKVEGYEQGLNMQLMPHGSLSTLQNTIVTSVKFDSTGLLWVSCYDGTVRCYDIPQWKANDNYQTSENKLFQPLKPIYRTDFTDSVLDMHLCEELKLGVCATSDGGAALFSLEDGQFFVGIMLFGVAARSVSIVKHDNEGGINVDMNGNRKDIHGYSVLCGGMDGTIHRIPLNVGPDGKINMHNPFSVDDDTNTSIKPRHTGPVMCLASPGEGMFISGGQDGALRVWMIDGSNNKATDEKMTQTDDQKKVLAKCKCMYALTGYKLWLGSACTDGDKLISDGGENNIIVRDYSGRNNDQGQSRWI